MNKKFLALMIVFVLSFSSVPVFAGSAPSDKNANNASKISLKVEKPVIFNQKITVTKAGGIFRVGFVTLRFPKNFIDNLPATFNVSIFSKDGEAGIEINPSTPVFNHNVLILVGDYKGTLYDVDKEKNVKVNIKEQLIIAKHFSWYRFR